MIYRAAARERERLARRFALLRRAPDEWQGWWHDPLVCRRLLELMP